MMKSRIYFIVVTVGILLITSGIYFVSRMDDKEVMDPVGGVDRPYYFRIELSQWSMKIIDLNRIEDLALEGSSIQNAFAQSTYTDYLGKLEKGSQVFFQIYSLDVQHGISINELDISIAILEPTEDIASTIPYFYDFFLPESDTTVSAYCQIFCGLGHSNMKFRFDVGVGEPQYGEIIFNIILFLNAIIAIGFAYFITSNVRRKVYITELASSSLKLKNSKNSRFALFDISMLSEKELVYLRLGTLDVENVGDLIKEFTAKSLSSARDKIISQNDDFNWNLIEL